MRSRHDVAFFACRVAAFSVLLAAVAWSLPGLQGLDPRHSLTVIPAASVILGARGASWRRKAAFAGAMLGIFVGLDAAFVMSGAMDYVLEASGSGLAASTLGVAYGVLSLALPLAFLLVFVRRDPSILWVKR